MKDSRKRSGESGVVAAVAIPTIENSLSASTAAMAGEERLIFERARTVIQPKRLFRFVASVYAERKLIVFLLAHFVGTMVVWQHFFLQKFQAKTAAIPEEAPRYWWKVIAPSAEFGTMHAILFQMALIPLTMSRYSIAQLATHCPGIAQFVPFNRMLEIHKHLGYVMVGFVFFATVFFFAFFGLMCADGDQVFCDKFTSEIMITGYFIIGFLLLVGTTSFFRHHIPYEIFYVLHHFVFIIYIITTAHTFDNVQRSGQQERSQTFRWYSATLLYYICDRTVMNLHNRFRTPMVSNSLVSGAESSRMVILRLARPAHFSFEPGQYAFIKIDKLSGQQWHPFSIASGPQSNILEFYIEVACHDETSWTNKLWRLLQRDMSKRKTLWVHVMGPYGTPLAACCTDYSHAVCIGAGTGIVPMLCLLKQHVRQVLRLDARAYFYEMEQAQLRLKRLDATRQRGSIAKRLWLACCRGHRYRDDGPVDSRHDDGDEASAFENHRTKLRSQLRDGFYAPGGVVGAAADGTDSDTTNTPASKENQVALETKRGLQKAVNKATRSLYGVMLLIVMTIYGVSLIGFTYSWCTLGIELYSGMRETTATFTCLFFVLFAIISVGVWDANHIVNYLDLTISIVSFLVSWYWFVYDLWANFGPTHMIYYTLLSGYMTARLWGQTVRPRHQALRNQVVKSDGIATSMERLDLVWVSRSATLVSEIMPDINQIWDNLVQRWGEEDARKVLRLRVFVTDTDETAVNVLQHQMANTNLYRNGNLLFERPDINRIIEDHTLTMIAQQRFHNSNTLLAFCGSPRFARVIHVMKINNDISTAITGNKHHQMEYIAESYGGYKREAKKKAAAASTRGYLKPSNSLASQDELQGEVSSQSSSIVEGDNGSSPSTSNRAFVPLRKTTHVNGSHFGMTEEEEFRYLLGISCAQDSADIFPDAYSF